MVKIFQQKKPSVLHPLQKGNPDLRLVYMTDERVDISPGRICASLPAGSLVVFRHYSAPDREALASVWRCQTKKHRLRLFVAADIRLARRIGADGVHFPEYLSRSSLPVSMPSSVACHSRMALFAAKKKRRNLYLVSPVFATASHQGVSPLGPHRLSRMIAEKRSIIALGGINCETVRHLKHLRISGVAAISGIAREIKHRQTLSDDRQEK